MDDDKNEKSFSDLIGGFSVPASLLVVCREKEQWFRNQLIKFSKTINEDLLDIYPDTTSKKEVITIKQSRELIHWLSFKPQGKIKLAFVHHADCITSEAANALLKIMEEMPKQAALILFMPTLNTLDTVKSRCRIIRIAEQEVIKNKHQQYISVFLSQSFAKQSKSIDEIVNSGKTSQFLISLEEWARGKILEEKSEKYLDYTNKIFMTRKNILSNANAKLALENLVLSFRNING